MRPVLCVVTLFTSLFACCQSGHWQGTIRIEDHAVAIILDLSETRGAWVGAVTFPDQQTSPIPLSKIAIAGGSVKLESPALVDFNVNLDAERNHMNGSVQMGRHRRMVQLTRTSAARAAASLNSTVGKDLEGAWEGTLKYGKTWGDMTPPEGQTPEGASFPIRLRFMNTPDGKATATLTRLDENAELPLELVVQNGDQVRFESFSAIGAFVGTKKDNELLGEWRQVGAEPIVLVLKKRTDG